MYKQLKSEVYNWHQILCILSDLFFFLALLITAFEILSAAIKGHPFFLALCLTYQGSKYFHPPGVLGLTNDNVTLHVLTLCLAIFGFGFWFFTHRFVDKRNVKLGYKMEQGVIVSVAIIDVMLFLIYFFGQSYIGETIETMKKCDKYDDWAIMLSEMPQCTPMCMVQRTHNDGTITLSKKCTIVEQTDVTRSNP